MQAADDWCSTENYPLLFTEVIKKLGVDGVEVQEINDDIFKKQWPVHGFIVLYKFREPKETALPTVTDDRLQSIYFARQMNKNACATHTAINLLLNSSHPHVDLGPPLSALKKASEQADPIMRGLVINSSHIIRAAHNSMAREPFKLDLNMAKEEVPYHLVGYTAIDGRVYELDGRREGPIDHGPVAPGQDWRNVVQLIIIKRIMTFTKREVYFKSMVLISNRKTIYKRKRAELLNQIYLLDMENDEDNQNDFVRSKASLKRADMRILYHTHMIRRQILPAVNNNVAEGVGETNNNRSGTREAQGSSEEVENMKRAGNKINKNKIKTD